MTASITSLQLPEDFKKPRKPTVGVRSPTSKEAIRVHTKWTLKGFALVKHKSKLFLVGPGALDALAPRLFVADLVAAASSNGEVFVWPLPLDRPTAEAAADKARKAWQRVQWANSDRSYHSAPATEEHDDPQWPSGTFEDLVTKGFEGRILESPEDLVVKEILKSKPLPEQ